MALFSKGLVLEQHKEPALSKNIVQYINPRSESDYFEFDSGISIDDLTADQIIEIARRAEIVDERDGRMLYRKLLRTKGKAAAVVADAVDDEPYVSSQLGPLLKMPHETCIGLELCERVAKSDNAFIMVYKKITDLEIRIPRTLGGFRIERLRGGYPAESSVDRLGLSLGGRKLIVGTGALIHLYRAATQHMMQSTVFVTVAGNCIASPMNLEVSMGMSFTNIIERCGLVQQPTRVISGGSMTGASVFDTDNTLITHTTRAVLAFYESRQSRLYSCVGCGRCHRVCPSGLNPMYIYRYMQTGYFANLKGFDAHLCIGCGTCSYICPSKLELSSSVERAKKYALDHFVVPVEEEDDDNEA